MRVGIHGIAGTSVSVEIFVSTLDHMAERSEGVNEGQKRLISLMNKAKKSGVSVEFLARKLDLQEQSRPMTWAVILLISMALYGFGIHSSALQMFDDWRLNKLPQSECAVLVPDYLSRALRPPVSCSICENVTEVEKVGKIDPDVFESRYAYTGQPVIITDATENWTASEVFSYEFFQNLYRDRIENWLTKDCQFFPYKTEFEHLGQFLNLTDHNKDFKAPWYVGWSNCDVEITDILRQHYKRPYFLPPHAEGKRLDWIFMGSKGYGAPMHVDDVEYPSWQAQLKGRKKWRLEPPPECFYKCVPVEVIVEPGETIVLDTNRWYHSTEIVSEEISITIGAEFD